MDKNESLIQEVYRNVKMGGDSIINLLDRVEDKGLRGEMTDELDHYRRFENSAAGRLHDRGLKPQELSTAAKLGAKAGMLMNTMLDTTTSHLAELMINGATMGVVDLEKKLNDGEYSSDDLALANEVLSFEKKSIDKLGAFL